MKHLSNPCFWFAGGESYENQKAFTYEGGTTLYHFCPSDTGILGNWIPVNVVFFANSKEHAAEVIERMLHFRIECAKEQYDYYRGEKGAHATHAEDFAEQNKYMLEIAETILKDRANWIITEAPTNQFYSVGWASNDTILE